MRRGDTHFIPHSAAGEKLPRGIKSTKNAVFLRKTTPQGAYFVGIFMDCFLLRGTIPAGIMKAAA